MVPTMIASIYGMNIGLSGQDSVYAFLVLLGSLLFSTIVVLFIFKKLDWI